MPTRTKSCALPGKGRGCREGCGNEVCPCSTLPTPPAACDDSFYKRLIDNLYDAVYFVDCERRITYWNRAAELLTGYPADLVIGMHCFDNILVHTDGNGKGLCRSDCPLSATILDNRSREADVYLRHKNGHRVSVSVRVQPIRNAQDETIGAVEIFSDNAAKREAEQKASQLEQMAFIDCLTRVPNRRFMELRLRQVLEESRRYGHHFGLLLVDLDHFKQINDSYGHSVGDAALIVVAQTLSRSLRAVDNVGRWGGDEFAVILPELAEDDLRRLAERCRVLVEQSKVAGVKGNVPLQVSIGGTLVRPDDTPESAMRRADEKLYESKNQGRGRVSVANANYKPLP